MRQDLMMKLRVKRISNFMSQFGKCKIFSARQLESMKRTSTSSLKRQSIKLPTLSKTINWVRFFLLKEWLLNDFSNIHHLSLYMLTWPRLTPSLLEGNESLFSTENDESKSQTNSDKHVYFPKFLTSSSLTELQLRYVIKGQVIFISNYTIVILHSVVKYWLKFCSCFNTWMVI